MAIQVRGEDFRVPPPQKVVIKNTDLAEAVLTAPDDAFAVLSVVHPVSPSEVSIDGEGRVIVDNPQFVAALQASLPSQTSERTREMPSVAGDNTGMCGGGC